MISRLKNSVCWALAAAAFCVGGNLSIANAYFLSSHYPPGLAEHLAAQLASRTNGTSYEFTGPTDGSNFFQRQPTNKPNFWLLGVTNIFAQSQYRLDSLNRMASCANYLTCISPRFCVTANHVGGGEGTTNVWLLPDGTYYSNSVLSSVEIGDTDIRISLMQKTNWTVCKILPDITDKVPFMRFHDPYRFALPLFVRFHQGIGRTNQFHSTFVSVGYSPGIFYSAFGNNAGYGNLRLTFGDYSLGDQWVGGDSSGAAYAIINNEAALVGTAFFPGYAPPLGDYTNEINAAMASLCASNALPVETVTVYDLSQFPNL